MGTCEILSLKQFQNGLKTSVSLNATEQEYFLNVSSWHQYFQTQKFSLTTRSLSTFLNYKRTVR